jgi:peptidyl-prolyl cis-trans isomerase C
MKQRSLIAAAVASALLLAGCNENAGGKRQAASSSKPTPENTVAMVNGQPISKAAVQALTAEIEQRRGGQGIPEEKIIDELVSRELLKQEAEKQDLAKDPAYAARIENSQRMLLSQMAAETYVKNVAVSDEDVKKEYDQRVGEMKLTEYKARHILVDTEDSAKDILKKLQKGEKFEALAKKLSKDPGSKETGGDLGWFNPQQMVPPFASAVASLKNGETTQAPVKTDFGWHIIKREDSRDQAPPPFDEVKEQIRNMLQTQKLQQHIADLKNTAKIERMAPPAKKEEAPAPAAATPAPAEQGQKRPDTGPEAGKPEPADAKASAKQPEPADKSAPAKKPEPADKSAPAKKPEPADKSAPAKKPEPGK